jgi:dipeptide/tripeptide permease
MVVLSTILMWIGRNVYRRVAIKPQHRTLWRTIKEDVVEIRHILKVFIPLPLFWALFYQQNSTWVFQAQSMQRKFGPWGFIPGLK